MGKNNNYSIGRYIRKLLIIGTTLGIIVGGTICGLQGYYENKNEPKPVMELQNENYKDNFPVYGKSTTEAKKSDLELFVENPDMNISKAIDTVVNSPVNMKNFAFVEEIENKNLYEVLDQYCLEKGIKFEDALSEFWAESLLAHTKYDESDDDYGVLVSMADAFGFTQMTEIAVEDLNQKGYRNRDGESFNMKMIKESPLENIYAGISFLKLIEDYYLKPNGIEPNKWNRAFCYLVGPPNAANILKKYGHNPKEYMDSLEHIIGKSAANDVKYYFSFMEMYDILSEQIQWPMSDSYDIGVVEQNGEMKGIRLYPKEDKTLYAILPGEVTVAGEVPNRYGSMANKLWAQVKFFPVEGYGPIKVSYIHLGDLNSDIALGKDIMGKTPIGEIGEDTQIWVSYSNEDDRGFSLNIMDPYVPNAFKTNRRNLNYSNQK